MSRGDNRRGRKKYRVRYDRLVVFLLIIITIAVLASSCVNKIRGVDNKANAPEIPKTTTTAPNKEQQTTAPKTEDTTTSTLETATSANAEFTTVTYAAEEAYKGDLVLVNNDCEYMFPEGDIDPITIVGNRNDYYQAGDYVTKLDKEVLEQLNILMEDYAKAQGKTTTDVFVQDGFRTYDEQVRRHSEGKSKTFTAGHTDYHTGRTFDMFLMDSDSSTGYAYFTADEWFSKNCGTYGFILRYPEGKQEMKQAKIQEHTHIVTLEFPTLYISMSSRFALRSISKRLRDILLMSLSNSLQTVRNSMCTLFQWLKTAELISLFQWIRHIPFQALMQADLS